MKLLYIFLTTSILLMNACGEDAKNMVLRDNDFVETFINMDCSITVEQTDKIYNFEKSLTNDSTKMNKDKCFEECKKAIDQKLICKSAEIKNFVSKCSWGDSVFHKAQNVCLANQ